jgi:hypothetical protein
MVVLTAAIETDDNQHLCPFASLAAEAIFVEGAAGTLWPPRSSENGEDQTKRPPLGKERRPQGRDGARSSTDEVPSSLLSEP